MNENRQVFEDCFGSHITMQDRGRCLADQDRQLSDMPTTRDLQCCPWVCGLAMSLAIAFRQPEALSAQHQDMIMCFGRLIDDCTHVTRYPFQQKPQGVSQLPVLFTMSGVRPVYPRSSS